MKQFKEFILEDRQKQTNFIVDSVYNNYAKSYTRDQLECVGWLDGSANSLIRNNKLYEIGIQENDSVLDVGCGVAHFYNFLLDQGWSGEYLGVDPNKAAIDMVEESINTMCGTIDDVGDTQYDWVIASGIFNLGLKEDHAYWILKNMIQHANKGISFNMLNRPYSAVYYEDYDPIDVKDTLKQYNNSKITICERYLEDNTEFTIHFYKD